MKTLLALGLLGVSAAVATFTAASDNMAHHMRAQDFPPLSYCFDKNTPPEVMANINQNIYGAGQRFFAGGVWPGGSGQGVSLTYSFPPDGIFLASTGAGDASGNNEINSRMNTLFAAQGGEATWKGLFRQMFDKWEEITGNTYTEISDDGAPWPNTSGNASRGDIRIVMRNIDGGSGTLAFNFFPSNGDMLLDRNEAWAVSGGNNFRFMRNTISHEHGHGIGLFHSCPQNSSKIMEPFINTNFDGPREDDVRGGQFQHGDPFEPNGTTGTATDLGALGLTVNTPVSLGLTSDGNPSLRNIADDDLYSFVPPAGGQVSATVTPIGTTYLNGPQNPNDTCSPGVSLNAEEQQDLVLEVLNSLGGVIATVDNNGFGGSETITDFNLGSVGTFFVRVRSGSSQGDVQRYTIDVSLGQEGTFGDINGDGCVGSTDFAILLGSWGVGAGGVADLNGDGDVNSNDLALLLGSWGTGPNC